MKLFCNYHNMKILQKAVFLHSSSNLSRLRWKLMACLWTTVDPKIQSDLNWTQHWCLWFGKTIFRILNWFEVGQKWNHVVAMGDLMLTSPLLLPIVMTGRPDFSLSRCDKALTGYCKFWWSLYSQTLTVTCCHQTHYCEVNFKDERSPLSEFECQ